MTTQTNDDDATGESYGFVPVVALTAVECPNCGRAAVRDKNDGTKMYQCGECLERFNSIEATYHEPGVDPRDNGATIPSYAAEAIDN